MLICLSEILYGLDLGILLLPVYDASWQTGEVMDVVEVQTLLLVLPPLLELRKLLLSVLAGG